MEKIDNLFDKIVKIANARGFVFNASSIYGGLRSSYDYGPLGALLKNNISEAWWKDINQDSKKFQFLKTHSGFLKMDGNSFTDLKNTLGVIYIVRDPRNVVTSIKNHYNFQSYNEACEHMFNEQKWLVDKDM